MHRYGMDYFDYLKSDIWRWKRKQVWRRAGGMCERCAEHNCRTPGEHTHHDRYPSILGEEPISDLRLLCADCHRFIHGHSDHDPHGTVTWDELQRKINEIGRW